VEWKQTSAFLGWQDYMATGMSDLAQAFEREMANRTFFSLDEKNGLLNTSNMGRHIVDWMPNGDESDQTVALGEFTASDFMSVTNGFAAHGLALLGEMLDNAIYKQQAEQLQKNIVK